MPSMMKILSSEVSVWQERIAGKNATISSLSIRQSHPSLQEHRPEASYYQHRIVENHISIGTYTTKSTSEDTSREEQREAPL